MDGHGSEFEDDQPEKKQRKPCAGRKLMRWNPEVDQLVLLMVDYISVKQGVPIPWDAVAKQIEPFLSGEAIKQHMAKLRKYREENGQRVPAKLEKSARRKSKATGDASNTPAKGKQGKKTKDEDDYDSDDDTPSKGRSLLWFAPPKKTKTPKTEKEEAPTTPAQPRAGGRKKAKTAEESGSSFEAKAKSTAKRSRKNQTIKKEEAGESDYESPTKKQKTLRLRAKEEIDYNEQLSDLEDDVLDARQPADNEEDENYEDTQEYPDAIIRHEPRLSQNTMHSTSSDPPKINKSEDSIFSNVPSPANAHGGLPFGPSSDPNSQVESDGLGDWQLHPSLVGNGFYMNPSFMYSVGQLPPRPDIYNIRSEEHHPRDPTRVVAGPDIDLPHNKGIAKPHDKQLSMVPEDTGPSLQAKQHKSKTKTPRQQASIKTKSTPETGSPQKKKAPKNGVPKTGTPIVGTPKVRTPKSRTLSAGTPESAQRGVEATVQSKKVREVNENFQNMVPSTGDDVFDDNTATGTTGMIPIANETGYGSFVPFDMASNYNPGAMFQRSVHGPAQIRPDQFAATPADISPAEAMASPYMFDAMQHTGVTTHLQMTGFDNASFSHANSSSQLSQFPSHTDSFTSAQSSNSSEFVPAIQQQHGPNFDVPMDAFDPTGYEMPMPYDVYANDNGLSMDGLYDY